MLRAIIQIDGISDHDYSSPLASSSSKSDDSKEPPYPWANSTSYFGLDELFSLAVEFWITGLGIFIF